MARFLLGGGGAVMEQYKQQTFCKKAFHYARKLNSIYKTNTYYIGIRGLSSIITANYERRRPHVVGPSVI